MAVESGKQDAEARSATATSSVASPAANGATLAGGSLHVAAEDAVRPSRFGALASPKYRTYWLGSLSSVSGSQLVLLGMGWVIVDTLQGSPLALGMVGGATAVPTILVNLFGGVLADRLNRRVLIMVTSLVTALLFTMLTVLDVTGALRIWHVVAISAGLGLVYGVDWPTRNAFFPMLISREQMMSAVALNAMVWQGTRIVAPAVGGIVIALTGTEVVFALSAAGAAGMFVAMIPLRVQAAASTRSNVLGELREGLAFIFQRRLFLALLGLTYASMFFGMQYVQLMPLMAKAFEVEASALGFMFTAIGLGAVCGTLVTLRLQRTRHLGMMLLSAIFVTTLFVMAFSAAPAYLLGVSFLFLASITHSIFSISTMTALQLRVPDHLRGRVMGIHTITFSLIPLGGLLGGAIADVTSVRVALAVSAGILSVIVAAVALTQREVRALDGTETT